MKSFKTITIILMIGLFLFMLGCEKKAEEVHVNTSGIDRPIFNKGYSFKEAKTVTDVYDVYTEFYLDYNPTVKDFVGSMEAFGYENEKLYLPEISTEAELVSMDVNTRAKESLEQISVEENSPEYYNKEVLLWYIEDQLNYLEHADQHFSAYAYLGQQADVKLYLLDFHEINNISDAESYVKRVEDAGRYLTDVHDRVEKSIESGIMIPKISGLKLFSELKGELASVNKYKEKLSSRLDALNVDSEKKTSILSAYDLAQTESLEPALEKLIDQAKKVATDSTYSRGLSEYDHGKTYYENYSIPHFVNLDISAQEIHDLGLSEVARIQEELALLFDELGYEGSLEENVNAIRQAGTNYKGQDAVDAYQLAMDDVFEKLDLVFHEKNIPEKNPTVRFFDYNSYLSPTIDGSREGYFNIADYTHNSSNVVALAIHEASPGHHLQIVNVLSNPDIPLLRKLLRTTSYTEGWALYSEKLSLESGFVTTDEAHVGMLLSELFRAARLVVDTGLHYYDWTQQEAVGYFASEAFVRGYDFEVLRYMTWPGQALAYKMGELKILELRQVAMDELGDQFNLKDFHGAILDNGYLPLEILEKKILAYIEENK
jgi:uncharacterized protein (DUF885 family)